MQKSMNPITINPRLLGELALPEPCIRCMWIKLHWKGPFPFEIPMPGIFSSIDAYTKRIIHAFYDHHKILPTWYPNIGKVSGYVDSYSLHWSRFLREDEKTLITLRGTPDDIFRLADDSFHIVDYKTAKATKTQDQLFPIYEIQLNAYAYISERTNMTPTSGISLIYMEPETEVAKENLPNLISRQSYSLRFKAVHKQVPLVPSRKIRPLLDLAREINEMQSPPVGKAACRNCESLARLVALI
jgi:hypothetical protein